MDLEYTLDAEGRPKRTQKQQAGDIPPVLTFSTLAAGDLVKDGPPQLADTGGGSLPWSWDRYHTQQEIVEYLQQLADENPRTCQLETIGTSVQGRKLVSLIAQLNGKATVNLDKRNKVQFPKSNAVLIANMHGDETGGRELLLRLAGELCSTSPAWRVSELLQSTTVHLIPTMNPDGYEAMTRHNANDVDLNRNYFTDDFPYRKPTLDEVMEMRHGVLVHYSAWSWSQVGNFTLQPEAVAVADYLRRVKPEVSANMHGGSLVANYAMDACDPLGAVGWCPSPEDPVPKLLAKTYAWSNPAVNDSNDLPFDHGTVQGALWYTAMGTLQDWTYHTIKRNMITLELHLVKNPPESDLQTLWDDNYGSMMRLLELSNLGLRAMVVDKTTREPLDADVTVLQPNATRGASTDSSTPGYFSKFMAPGVTYVMSIQPIDPRVASGGCDPDAVAPARRCRRYAPIRYSATLEGTWAGVVQGEGLSQLTISKTFLAKELGATTKRRRTRR